MVSAIKVAALKYMAELTDIQQLRRFLGMVNQSYQHIPNLAEVTHPLRGLRNKKNACVWAPPQQRALETFKEKLSSAPALEIFDITLDTMLSADASSYGVGAILSQKQTDG